MNSQRELIMAVLKLIFWLVALVYFLAYFCFSVLQSIFGWFPEKQKIKNKVQSNGKSIRPAAVSQLDGIDTSGMSRQDRELLSMLKSAQAGGNVSVTVSKPKHRNP